MPFRRKIMTIKVTLTILIIWFGIAFYLFTLDRRVKRIEEELREK